MKLGFTLVSISVGAVLCVAKTVYLAGDSTTAKGGGGFGTQGWGEYLGQYLTIPVVNLAVGGTSARSYTDGGNFQSLIDTVQSGDFVVIEFGHNDGYALRDNFRQDAIGSDYHGTETVITPLGKTIVIHTFTYYIENAVAALVAKGAIPIVASQTPNNFWSGTSISVPSRFVEYARISAKSTGVTYVNHYAYVAQAYDKLGQSEVNAFYPRDHIHTSPAGAQVVANAFVRGLLCESSTLTDHVKLHPTGTCIN